VFSGVHVDVKIDSPQDVEHMVDQELRVASKRMTGHLVVQLALVYGRDLGGASKERTGAHHRNDDQFAAQLRRIDLLPQPDRGTNASNLTRVHATGDSETRTGAGANDTTDRKLQLLA